MSPVKHSFSSAKVNAADNTLASSTAWNNNHTKDDTITPINANYTQTDADETIHATGGSGGITITLLSATGRAGRPFFIKRVDTGIGLVTLSPVGGQGIEGQSSYLLTNQYQSVLLYSDGSNWFVRHAN